LTRAGIQDDEFFSWGIAKAKVSLNVCDRLKDSENGNYVVVTGINPTPLGEGKSSKLYNQYLCLLLINILCKYMHDNCNTRFLKMS
jgi:hypothetical protein